MTPPSDGPEIPVLRPKEKEKKGAGIPLFTGSGPGATIGTGIGSSAASVGGSLSSPGFLGSARIAMAVSRLLGGQGTLLGGLFASQLGAPMVLGGMLAWGALIGAAALSLVKRPSLDATAGTGMAALEGPASSMVIDAPKDRSLNFVANANQGELQWQEENPMAPKEEKQEAPPEQPKAEIPQPQMPDISKLMADAQQKAMKGGRFGELTKDVSRLGGGLVAQVAGKQLKDGTPNGFTLKKTFTPAGSKAGKLKTFGRQMQPAQGRRLGTLRARSSRAMGQLKFATNLSRSGAFSSSDPQSRQFATDAFEAKVSQSGETGELGGGVAMPAGSLPTDGLGLTQPAIPETNVTPYQGDVDAARQLGDMAGMLKAMGLMMIAMGAALIAAGRALLGNPTTAPIGAALIGAGIALTITGLMMIAMGANMAQQGKNQAKKVGEADGQKEQQEAASSCVDRAYAAGKSVKEVCPNGEGDATDTSRGGGASPGSTVHEDVVAEQSSDYQLQ